MSLTVPARLPAFCVIVIVLAWAAPAYADKNPRPAGKHPARATPTEQRLDLYSPRVRRSTLMYLKLRLLELREEGLDRARAAIERRLSIDDLLADPPRVPAQPSSRR